MARSANKPPLVRGEGSLIAFRYSNYDTPFWVRPNSSPGRWAVPEDGPTQYLTLHPDGAWADLARRENLRTDAELALVRTPIWVAEIDAQLIVDYSTPENAAAGGFPSHALVSEDHGRCQAEGRRLRERYAGVLAPSAAIEGVLNLTLFGPRRRIPWRAASQLTSTIPATVVAVGAPPAGLSQHVRYFGTTLGHAEARTGKTHEDG